MFLFFLSTIGYLVYGVFQTLRKYQNESKLSIIRKVLWFSITNLGLLFLVIPAIGVFAGSFSTQPSIAPQSRQADIPWSDWLRQAPFSALRAVGILFVLFIFIALILTVAIIIINPKDKEGSRRTRRQIIKEAFQKIRESKGQVFTPFIGIFIFMYLLNLLVSLLSFYLAGKFSTTIKSTFALQAGWSSLFGTIVMIYALIAVYLTFIVLYPPSSVSSEDDTPLAITSSFIYLASVCVLLIVPLYAIRVYPVLPQQIGGGQLLRVDAVISDKTIASQFEEPDVEIYLIDRTSNTSFFVLQGTSQSEYKIVEIQNGLIQSITYNGSP
jgi:hypothetical protein